MSIGLEKTLLLPGTALPQLISTKTAVSSNLVFRQTAEVKRIPGAVWGQGGSDSATCGARDVISIMAVTRGPASITATIGDSREMTFRTHWHSWSPLSYFEMPFDSQTTGPVQITLNGKTTRGPAIGNESDHESVSPAGMLCRAGLGLICDNFRPL